MAYAARAAWGLAFEPDARVLKIIRTARARGIRTALFTNNGPLLEQPLGADLIDVGNVFDQLRSSAGGGSASPSPMPAAFTRPLKRSTRTPAPSFLVDDSQANVDAAQAAGWQAHRYTNALNLHAALATLGR